jgi:radical SAM/Cys-rich protein
MKQDKINATPSFCQTLQEHHLRVVRLPLEIVQINVGKLCDLACVHCHVEAGPKRTEIMERKTAERITELLQSSKGIQTVDLTGGAPELNPNFRYLVQAARGLEKEVIDRCNLTVFFRKGQGGTPQFLRENRVHVIASLPCYSKENVEKQRGHGVFDKNIEGLHLLNDLGYGKERSDLKLDLVYNPQGASLPPPQGQLEREYKKELKELFGIEFHRLLTITNMPIKRFYDLLKRQGKLQSYLDLLVANFNPRAALGVMCRNLISISWDGGIYDCDFNQMLELPLGGKKRTIWDITSFEELAKEEINFANHCYGCTAGAGSSCSGTLI